MTKKASERAKPHGRQPPDQALADHVFAETASGPSSPDVGNSAEGHAPGETNVAPAASPTVDEEATDAARQLAEAESRVLRAQADLENYRKRVRREMDEERRFAALPLIRDLLPVIDNLRRATESMGDEAAAANHRAGIEMVTQQFLQVLAQHHCHPMDPVGEPFDPTWHEAIGSEQNTEVPSGTVLRVEQTGYRLHDRVVRPAYVVVSVSP